MTIYIWDLGTERELEIQCMRLANTSVLLFIQTDCQMLRIGLIKQSC